MKKCIIFLFTLGLILIISNKTWTQEYKKLAQTGCKFLGVGMDARSTAMGEAFTSIQGNSASIFYNPAGMANLHNFFDLNINHATWIADIKHYSAGIAFNPFGIKYGVLGFSFIYVDYGELERTMVDPKTDAGYVDMGTFSPKALSVGLGYAIQLSERFSVGGQIKYVSQEMGSNLLSSGDEVTNKVNVLAFDFGTLYSTGWKSLVFGMSVRNFSKEVKYQNEGFQLPLTFKIGISMDGLDLLLPEHKDHSLLVSIDAVHNRDYPEQVNLGLEYTFMNLLSLRGGYMFNNDEKGIVGGIGIHKYGFEFDYSYTPFGVFKSVNRLTFRITL